MFWHHICLSEFIRNEHHPLLNSRFSLRPKPEKLPLPMNITPLAGQHMAVEHFRNLLFHIQLGGGSFNDMLAFVKSSQHLHYYKSLNDQDPSLLRQLMAREHVLEAKRLKARRSEAMESLKRALELDPKCPEACLEMGNLCDVPEKAMMWYQRAMQYTEDIVGPKRLVQLLEDFRKFPWKQVELYTYLKAKACLAERLFLSGYYEEAIFHFQELLTWNPADDLQVRQMLLAAYLHQNQLKESAYLLHEYKGDWSAVWYFCKAFHRFKLMGDNSASRRSLVRAYRRNLWVPIFLFGLMDSNDLHGQDSESTHDLVYKIGTKAEAHACIRIIAPVFYDDSEMVDWAWKILKESV